MILRILYYETAMRIYKFNKTRLQSINNLYYMCHVYYIVIIEY